MVRTLALFLVSAIALCGQLGPGNWRTDLSKKSIDLRELRSGGPPKDGIPAILDPKFVGVDQANTWLAPKEPVLIVEHAGEARAYPLQILIFHELANDQIGDLPILVSYCPLCNSAITFDRRIDGKTYTFGVSGMLRNSDMVMYDHQTDSLWQQLTGDAIVGGLTGKQLDRRIDGKTYTFGVSGMLRNSDMVMYDHQTDSLWQQLTGDAIVGGLTGKQLTLISSQVVPWDRFAKSFPDGKVLSRQTGHRNRYGTTPYGGYEFSNRLMFPVAAKRQADVRPMERMLTLTLAGKTRAYTFEHLRGKKVTDGKIKDRRYVVFYEPTALSTMDARTIADSRAVGSVGVFSPVVDGEKLTFQFKNGKIIDKDTKTTWDILGKAIDGPLAGQQLDSIEHGVYYAFALLAFYPRAELVGVQAEPLRIPAGGFGQQPGPPQTSPLGGQPLL